MDLDEALAVAPDVCEPPERRDQAIDVLIETIEKMRDLLHGGGS